MDEENDFVEVSIISNTELPDIKMSPLRIARVQEVLDRLSHRSVDDSFTVLEFANASEADGILKFVGLSKDFSLEGSSDLELSRSETQALDEYRNWVRTEPLLSGILDKKPSQLMRVAGQKVSYIAALDSQVLLPNGRESELLEDRAGIVVSWGGHFFVAQDRNLLILDHNFEEKYCLKDEAGYNFDPVCTPKVLAVFNPCKAGRPRVLVFDQNFESRAGNKPERNEAADEEDSVGGSQDDAEAEAEEEDKGSDPKNSEDEMLQEQESGRSHSQDQEQKLESDSQHSEEESPQQDQDLEKDKSSPGQDGQSASEIVCSEATESGGDDIESDCDSETPQLARKIAPQKSRFWVDGENPFKSNDDNRILRVTVCPITHQVVFLNWDEETEQHYIQRGKDVTDLGVTEYDGSLVFERPASSYSGNWYLVGYPDPEPHERFIFLVDQRTLKLRGHYFFDTDPGNCADLHFLKPHRDLYPLLINTLKEFFLFCEFQHKLYPISAHRTTKQKKIPENLFMSHLAARAWLCLETFSKAHLLVVDTGKLYKLLQLD